MRILVIRRDNIGDLVCATPLITALRKHYPSAHIAALVNKYNAPVLQGNKDLDEVHAYTKLKHRLPGESWLGIVVGRLRLLAALRSQRLDYVVLAKSGFDRNGLALARQLRPRHIVGFAGSDGRRTSAISIPVRPVPYAELHEVEVMMKLAGALGISQEAGPLRVFPSPERMAHWRTRLRAGPRRWVAVHISAREPSRRWPAERFIQLIMRLAAAVDTGVVLLWAPGGSHDPRHPGDDEKAACIAGDLPESALVAALRTQELEDLVAVLALCDAFIGADGGAMHLAAGVGRPIVALFENLESKKRHWHPWKVPYELVCAKTPDITDISVEQVIQAWTRLVLRLERA